MAPKKLLDWFLTERGRTFAYYTAGVVTSSALLASYLPHTLLLNYYKDIIHLYKNGVSVPLPKELYDRFEKALDLIGVPEEDKQFNTPFFSYGFETVSAGSGMSRFGIIVGIPTNFTYKNIDSVDKSKIKTIHDSIAWETEEGQNLLKSLVLSEKAQLYAIAKEIRFRQSPKLYFDTFISTASCIIAYGLANTLNTKFNLYSKPRTLRVIMYSLVGLFAFGNYAMLKDLSQMYLEEKIDKELREMSPVFAEGGAEYYEKILQRNIALRNILGREGERLYSVLGNENYFFRNKHIPLVQRKEFFKKKEITS